MQHQANSSEDLKFATIVPSAASTRHVAAAAFYHCLGEQSFIHRHGPSNSTSGTMLAVLATKNMVGLKQQDPYGPIVVSIV